MNTQNALLRVNELHVSVEDKEILHGIDLTIQPGETHVLMGPNGTGKSTLGYALIGNQDTRLQKEAFFLMEKISQKSR